MRRFFFVISTLVFNLTAVNPALAEKTDGNFLLEVCSPVLKGAPNMKGIEFGHASFCLGLMQGIPFIASCSFEHK